MEVFPHEVVHVPRVGRPDDSLYGFHVYSVRMRVGFSWRRRNLGYGSIKLVEFSLRVDEGDVRVGINYGCLFDVLEDLCAGLCIASFKVKLNDCSMPPFAIFRGIHVNLAVKNDWAVSLDVNHKPVFDDSAGSRA